jgi:NADH-quinone oxidoreductase subunit G
MPTLTIDGLQVTVEAGVSVLQAAERIGIKIPRFCYHPDLSISGNCRMCLVEIEKTPKLSISCATKAEDGMVVHTNTEKVRKARRGVLEFLLLSHPIDCPICDQAGECYLQDQYMEYGLYKSRFGLEDKVRKHKVIDLGPRIVLDTERCVLCSRCIRYFKEVVGSNQMGFILRGAHAEIGTFDFKPVEGPYVGNAVDICPVGALTSRDFRFQCRVWLLKGVPSVCCGCSTGCNIRIDSYKNVVYRFVPRRNPEVNRSWICDHGRLLYTDLRACDRCTVPARRLNGNAEPVTWKRAFEEAQDKIRTLRDKYGPGSIAGIGSSKATNEDLFLFKKLIRDTYGSPHLDFRLDETGVDPGAPEDAILLKKDRSPNTRGALDMGILPGPGGLDTMGILREAMVDRIKVLWILEDDLLTRLGGEDWIRKALGKVEVVVVQTSRNHATAELAHFVFPAALFPEVNGTVTNFQRRVQKLSAAVAPPPQVKPHWETLAAFIRAAGGKAEFERAEEVLSALAAEVPDYRDCTIEKIGTLGWKIS